MKYHKETQIGPLQRYQEEKQLSLAWRIVGFIEGMSFESGLEKWPEQMRETAETKVCIVQQQCMRTTCTVNVSSLFFLKRDVERERF